MELVIANHIGFCPGVMAVVELTKATLDLVENEGKELYCIGSLVHNDMVRDSFSKRGVIFLGWDAEFEKIEPGYAIISAHGIPEELERRLKVLGFILVDGTCKKIKKNRQILKKYGAMGYFTVIVGLANHSEVKALMGTELFPGVKIRGRVISSIEEVKDIPQGFPLLVIAQTTFEFIEYQKIVSQIRKNYSNTKILNTLCSEILLRRKEIKTIIEENNCDCGLVIGGKKSANTISLLNKVEQLGIDAYQIDEASTFDFKSLAYERVCIFSGASTPVSQINQVLENIKGK
ncbi:MAG: hypothetical protein WC162_07050 [Sphaerochaetaceae bacterium]|nr:hypothetical protein [Sphaerochaetaceae bacterium]